jgi:hypothetical protein
MNCIPRDVYTSGGSSGENDRLDAIKIKFQQKYLDLESVPAPDVAQISQECPDFAISSDLNQNKLK